MVPKMDPNSTPGGAPERPEAPQAKLVSTASPRTALGRRLGAFWKAFRTLTRTYKNQVRMNGSFK